MFFERPALVALLLGFATGSISQRSSADSPRTSDLSGSDANTIFTLADEQNKAADFARDTLARLGEIQHEGKNGDLGQLLRTLLTAENRGQLHGAVARLSSRLAHDHEDARDQLLDWMEVMNGERPMPKAKDRKQAETTAEKLAESTEIGVAWHTLEGEIARITALHQRILRLMPKGSLWREPLRLEQVFAGHPWALRVARSLDHTLGNPPHPILPKVFGIDEQGRVLAGISGATYVIKPVDRDRVLITDYHDDSTVPIASLRQLKQARAKEDGTPLDEPGDDASAPSKKREKAGLWVAAQTTLVDRTKSPAVIVNSDRDLLNTYHRARLYGHWQNDLQYEPAVHLHEGHGNRVRMIHLISGETQAMFNRPLELKVLGEARSKDVASLLRIAEQAASRQHSIPTEWETEAPIPKRVLERSGTRKSHTRQVTPRRGRIARP